MHPRERHPTTRPHFRDVRRRTDELLCKTRGDIEQTPAEELQQLVQDLQAHQVELEGRYEQLRQAQAELEESRDDYRELHDFAPVGLATLHRDGRILSANRRLAEVLGTDLQELVGRNLIDFIGEGQRAAFSAHLERVFVTGNREVCELELRRGSGEALYVRLQSVAVRTSPGRSFSCRTAVVDITELQQAEVGLRRSRDELEDRVARRTAELTEANSRLREEIRERRQTEEALRESEARFRRVADHAPVLIWMSDTAKKCTWVNKTWLDFTGRALERELGHGWSECIHPDDRDAAWKGCTEAFLARRPFQLEFRMRRRDGCYRCLLDWGVPRYTEGGEFRGYIGAAVDISDRKEAEESLERSQRRLQAFFDNALDGILLTDDGGRLVDANPAATLILGYGRSELMSKTLSDVFARDEGTGFPDRWDAFLEEGRRTLEASTCRKDGSGIELEIHMAAHIAPALHLVVIRDITERRRSQERVLQAERLSAIGEAITGLAHESRNALQRSQACLEMLSSRVESRPEVVDLLRDIQDSQDDLHRLYEEVREYAAPIAINPQPLPVGEIVREAWGHLASARRGRDVRLQEVGTGGEALCPVDRFAIRNVFRNIFENALAACSDPVVIEVVYDSERETAHGPAVCIAVRDNGPGLTPEQRRRVFDPFYTTKTQGTGLGLAISKRLVEAHGGELAIGSGGGRGAEFQITLRRDQP